MLQIVILFEEFQLVKILLILYLFTTLLNSQKMKFGKNLGGLQILPPSPPAPLPPRFLRA